MSGNPTTQPQRGAKRAYANPWTFLVVSFVIFGATVLVLSSFDLLPDPSKNGSTAPGVSDTRTQDALTGAVLPEKIEIPKIKLTATVANPTTTDPDILDKDLLYGAVRYPTSGSLGVSGQNVVLFGHSSYLPVVHNQAYKLFDGIQSLSKGDQILVTGGGTTYVYEVDTVASANAQTDGIPLSVEGNKLTLVTCDSFKTKSDRFVVIAHLVDSHPSAS